MYWARVVDDDLVRDERVPAKWPTTTTGMSGWKSWGGLPLLTTSTRCTVPAATKSTPPGMRWTVPGTTTPSRRNVCVPSVALWASAWSTVSK